MKWYVQIHGDRVMLYCVISYHINLNIHVWTFVCRLSNTQTLSIHLPLWLSLSLSLPPSLSLSLPVFTFISLYLSVSLSVFFSSFLFSDNQHHSFVFLPKTSSRNIGRYLTSLAMVDGRNALTRMKDQHDSLKQFIEKYVQWIITFCMLQIFFTFKILLLIFFSHTFTY